MSCSHLGCYFGLLFLVNSFLASSLELLHSHAGAIRFQLDNYGVLSLLSLTSVKNNATPAGTVMLIHGNRRQSLSDSGSEMIRCMSNDQVRLNCDNRGKILCHNATCVRQDLAVQGFVHTGTWIRPISHPSPSSRQGCTRGSRLITQPASRAYNWPTQRKAVVVEASLTKCVRICCSVGCCTNHITNFLDTRDKIFCRMVHLITGDTIQFLRFFILHIDPGCQCLIKNCTCP